MRKELRELLCPKCNCTYGAPMGRSDVGAKPDGRVRDVVIPLDRDGYDPGGAYWGIGRELRCEFTSDGEYRRYYRK